MHWIKNILREVFGLFVDDGKFALAILIWLGAVRLALPRLAGLENMKGIILFLGLGFLLAESTIRYSKGKRPS